MDVKVKSLEQINYAEKTEKSLVEFNNWVFGISIGIYTVLIFKINEYDMSTLPYGNIIYKSLVIYAMLVVFITGLTKYHFFLRKNRLSIRYGILLKLLTLRESKSEKDFKSEWNEAFQSWVTEHNKIVLMSKFLNLSIIATGILIVLFSILMLCLI